MAAELKTRITLDYLKDGSVAALDFNGSFDISTGRKFDRDVIAATSEAQVNLGDVTTIGALAIQNYDPDNFLEFGYATGVRPNRVPPLRCTIVYPGTNALWIKADTASLKCRVVAVNA
jgi:hypothetical protein